MDDSAGCAAGSLRVSEQHAGLHAKRRNLAGRVVEQKTEACNRPRVTAASVQVFMPALSCLLLVAPMVVGTWPECAPDLG